MYAVRLCRSAPASARNARRRRTHTYRPTSAWRHRFALERLEGRCLLASWSGTLPDGTIWGATPGEVEIVTANVDVPAGATLTILEGAVVKFQGSTTRLSVAGTVQALGTADNPIHLTSIHDDAVGGDTNGNGAATSPAAGNWGGVFLAAATADVQLAHATIRYGGFIVPLVEVAGGQLALDRVTLSNANRTALQINSTAAGAYDLADVTISDIGNQTSHHGVFVNSNSATVSATNLATNNIRGTHVIANNAGRFSSSGTTMTGTGVRAIAFPGGTITDDRAWDDSAVYYLSAGNVVVAAGASLTIPAGQVIKAGNGVASMVVQGALDVQGTEAEPVVFTSIHDDTVGGDTNGNGDATSPAAGNWNGIQLSGAAADASLAHATIRYAGFTQTMLQVDGGQLALDHVTLRDANRTALQFNSGADGVYDLNDVTISDIGSLTGHHGVFVNSTAATVNATNLSTHNIRGTHVVANNAGRWDSSGTTMTGTGVKAIAFPGGTITDSRAWDDSAVYFLSGGNVTVAAGASLAIPAGQVVKANSLAQLIVQGTLDVVGTAAEPVVFTSIRDDSAGGDTNDDGDATMPGPASWQNISLGGPDAAVRIDHAEIRYAGALTRPAVEVNDGTLALTNSLVVDNANAAVRVDPNADGVDLTGTTLRNVGGIGVLISTTSDAPINLTNLAVENATGVGVQMDMQSNVDLSGATFVGAARDGVVHVVPGTMIAGTRHWAGQTYIIGSLGNGNLTIAQTGNLTVAAGAVLKFGSQRGLQNDGRFTALGTPEKPVILTSLRDDSAGGDTNEDGDATAPFAGSWFSYWHRDTQGVMTDTAVSDLRNVEIRYAGAEPGNIPTPAVLIDGGAFTASNLLVRDSLDAGLRSRFSHEAVVTATNLTIRGTGAEALSFGITSPGGGNVTLDGVHLEDIFGDAVRIVPEYLSLAISNLTMTNVGGLRGERVVAATNASAIRKSLTLGHTGLVVLENRLEVETGGSLSFVPGTVVKVVPRANTAQLPRAIVAKNGPLVVAATGASPVVFTSFRDDARGGDTNGDGAATVPAAGDWSGIELRAAGSSLGHVGIHYAGETGQALLIEYPDVTAPSPSASDGAAAPSRPAGSDHDEAPIISTDALRFSHSDVYAFISVQGSNSREVHLSNSYFDNPGATAIHVNGNDRLLTLYNNTIVGGQNGVVIERLPGGAGGTQRTRVELVNNIFADQSQAAVTTDGIQDIELDFLHNVFSPGGVRLQDLGGTAVVDQDQNNITADPMLDAQGRPLAGSPAIDAARFDEHTPLSDNEGKSRYNVPAIVNSGQGFITFADIGAFEFWNPTSGVSLTTDLASFLELPDDFLEITTTTTNRGHESTAVNTSQWTDKYFLVELPEQRGSQVVPLGEAVRTQAIDPNEFVINVDTFPIPPLFSGRYVVRVQTDVKNELNQSARSPSADSPTTFDHQTPLLPQGGFVDGQVRGSGMPGIRPSALYEFVVPPGCALRIHFDGESQLMRMLLPGTGDFSKTIPVTGVLPDIVVAPGGSVTIPNPGQSPLSSWVTIEGAVVSQAFRITTEIVKDELASATPDSIGNSGSATVTVLGGPFDNTDFALVSQDGQTTIPAADARVFADGGTAAVTFPSGIGQGTYDLAATWNGATAGFSSPTTVAPVVGNVRDLGLVDLDGDGDVDIVAAGDAGLVGYQNLDGQGRSWKRMGPIDSQLGNALAVATGDFDDDQRNDIAAITGDNTLVSYRNLGGGTFAAQVVVDPSDPSGNTLVATFDADGDGRDEVYSTSNAGQTWKRYVPTASGFSAQVIGAGGGAFAIGDLNGDGLPDFVGASPLDNTLRSFHFDGNTFGAANIIASNLTNVDAVKVADVDGAAGGDIIVAGNDTLTLYHNQGGGTFGSGNLVASDLSGQVSLAVGDLNGDGRVDLIVGTSGDDRVTVRINDGSGGFGNAIVINPNAPEVNSVVAGDFNGDGRVDIATSALDNDTITISSNDGIRTSTLDNAITVIDGGQSDLSIRLDGPDGVRAGVPNRYTINWQNTGNVDQTTNVISINLPSGLKASLTPNGEPLPQDLLLYSFVPNTTSNSIVPPGASGSMDVYLTSDVGVSQFDVGISGIAVDSAPLNLITPFWDDLMDASQLLPSGADSARWDAMAVNVASFLGPTLGAALRNLADNATIDTPGDTLLSRPIDAGSRSRSIAAGEGLLSVSIVDAFANSYPTPTGGTQGDGVHQDFVLIIAVEDYSNVRAADWKDLPGTQNDLRELLHFYRSKVNVGRDQIVVLRDLPETHDDDITPERIRDAWSALVAKSDADDKIKVHYSGHGDDGVNTAGATLGAWVMNDPSAPAGGEIVFSGADLKAMLQGTRNPGETFISSDSCHSGALANDLNNLPNVKWQAACAANEEEVDKGTLTERWIAAKQDMANDVNGDGQVTLSEAFTAAAADHRAITGLHPETGGDPNVDQKLHDDLGDAAKILQAVLAELMESLLRPETIFRKIRNFFGFDPNEKTGPIGVGAENFVAEAGRLDYTVYFENDPTFANAPAQVVTLTDQLSADLDWNTFQFGEVAFGDNTFTLAGTRQLSTASAFDVASGLVADVQATFDPATGLATWTFATIDPRTGERTIDPLAGFLPPNVTSPEGEGHVAFSVRPRDGLASGAAIANSASIVFDTNDPIITNEHVVTFDFDPPTSAVDPLPAALGPSYVVSWSGADAGSGIASFDIYVSVDGADFVLWQNNVTDTSAMFDGAVGHTYAFYSVATDRVGHVEAPPTVADAQTMTILVVPADLDGDLAVGLLDLAILQRNLGATAATATMGDLTGDGVVDRADAALFSTYYGRIAPPTSSPPASPSAVLVAAGQRARAASPRLLASRAVDDALTSLNLVARRRSAPLSVRQVARSVGIRAVAEARLVGSWSRAAALDEGGVG